MTVSTTASSTTPTSTPAPTMTSFGGRLATAVERQGPLCVGIDPHSTLLRDWGLPDSVAGLREFTETAVAALGGQVAVVKPQSAFYERFGSAGIAVLEDAVRELRAAGSLVLLDVKRGDIGSTAQAYADAYLRADSPIAADAITAHPYLGFGALAPLIDTAHAHGRGVFVVALSSNPEGASVQQARDAAGVPVGQAILRAAAAANAAGPSPAAGSIGAVVGATLTRDQVGDSLDIGGPLLAPGIGAQGATAASLRALFGPALTHVLPAASREVLRHGPDPAALRSAALRLRDEIAALLSS